jgi:hypothetical protein
MVHRSSQPWNFWICCKHLLNLEKINITNSVRRGLMTKSTNRNILIPSVVVLLLLMAASFAWGRGPADVSETVHNMSVTTAIWNQYSVDNANLDEVCVFCHTPHGGSLTGPLWNHSLPDATSFTHYNSVSLSSTLQGLSVSRDIGNESLLCMSCHDGSVAVPHLINDPNIINGAAITINGNPDQEIVASLGNGGARIGATQASPAGVGDLTDDHPISFSYQDVYDEYQGGSRVDQLHSVAAAITGIEGEGVRFFGATSRVECSSCHDPHVSYDQFASPPGDEAYRPFLIRPNDGSKLCLSCHNK